MVEKLETDNTRRLQAGTEAVELLHQAGFNVHDAELEVEKPASPVFTVEASLSVGENTRPLQALEDEGASNGAAFSVGFMAGVMLASSCTTEECGYDIANGECTRDDCQR